MISTDGLDFGLKDGIFLAGRFNFDIPPGIGVLQVFNIIFIDSERFCRHTKISEI